MILAAPDITSRVLFTDICHFLHSHILRSENFTLKSAKIYDKIALRQNIYHIISHTECKTETVALPRNTLTRRCTKIPQFYSLATLLVQEIPTHSTPPQTQRPVLVLLQFV